MKLMPTSACLVLLTITSMLACSRGSPTEPAPPSDSPTVASVEVTGPSNLASFGATGQFSAVAKTSSGTTVSGQTFVWSSSNPSIATVQANGVATAAGNGSTVIQAQTSGIRGEATLVVEQQPVAVVIDSGSDTLAALGDTVRLSAVVEDANGHDIAGASVSWTSTDLDGETSEPTVVSVDDAGLATALAPGSALIIANTAGLADTATVTVRQAVESLVLTPVVDTLAALGATVQFSATVTDENGHPVQAAVVSWMSSDPAVKVDENGLSTAVANGEAQIIASSGGMADTASVVVEQVAHAIVVSPNGDTLTAIADTLRLSASVVDELGASIEHAAVSWLSMDEATVTVDSGGLVTAVGNGTASIVADAGSVADTATLHVQQQVVGVSIDPSSDTLTALADTTRLTAVAVDPNSYPIAGAQLTWSTLDPAVASIDEAGLVTADSSGTANIVVSAESQASDTAVVVVAQVVDSVSISPPSDSLAYPGDTLRFTASVTDRNGYPVQDATVGWTSADQAVASVDGGGLVTAMGYGSTYVTATSGSESASALISVTVPGTIVFDTDRDGNWELYSIRSDGTNLTNLTQTGGHEQNPVVSPDGTQVAYGSNQRIYTMNIDGTDQNLLYLNFWRQTARHPSWSPTGSHLVISILDSNWMPYVIDAQDGSVQSIPHGPMNSLHYSWSPTDSIIAGASSGQDKVIRFGINHGTEETLTAGSVPRFSPAGDRIAFHRVPDGESYKEIYVMDSDGQNVVRLTYLSSWAVDPTWSPDGTRIAFVYSGDLWIMDADGSNAHPVPNGENAHRPSWWN